MANVKSVYIFWFIAVGVFGQAENPGGERTKVSAEYCSKDYECSLPFIPYTNASFRCSCHPACTLFLDCCYNVDAYNNHAKTPHRDDAFLGTIERYMKYFYCTTDIISQGKYRMVSACPPSWPVPNNCDSTHTVGDLQDLTSIPVVSADGVTFRNIYCALCHGHGINSLTPWSLEAACDDVLKYQPNTNLTLDEKVQDLIDRCDRVFLIPPVNHTFSKQTVIPCRGGEDEQLYTCTNTSYNDNYKCVIVLAPIEVDSIVFKNRYCAECYYDTIDDELVFVEDCNDMFMPGLPPPNLVPISITFNFGSQTGGFSISSENNQIESVSVTCEEGQVFDPTSFDCLQLTCPVGYILQDDHCVRNGSAPACEVFLLNITVTMEFTQHSKHQCHDNLASGFELFIECIPADVLDTFSDINVFNNFSCFANHDTLLFNLEMNISSTQIAELFSPEHRNNHIFAERCENCNIAFSAACISGEELVCGDLLQNPIQWSIVDTSPPILFFHSTNATLDVSGVRFGRDLRFARYEGAVDTFYLQKCRCPLVTLGASHFFQGNNISNTLIYAKNESIRFTPSMYTWNEDGSINVCNFLESEGEIFRFFPEYSLSQSVISTIGISLSVIALTFSLITYSVFSELRNRIAPILIMNLCGCLIVAQMCLLFAGIAASSPTICAIIAGTGHFFWLAAFSSSTLVGFSLSQAFSLRNQTNLGEKPSCATSLIYIAGCFIAPVAICGSILALYMMDGSEKYSIAYGGVGGCWIGDSNINILAFGLPVAISITLNIVLFVYIVFSLCIHHKRSRRMRTLARGAKLREFLVYTKIFIILGLTWISGYIAYFTDIGPLWYAFIILTSLQGVFIFIAFTFKSRVYGLWRKKLRKTESITF